MMGTAYHNHMGAHMLDTPLTDHLPLLPTWTSPKLRAVEYYCSYIFSLIILKKNNLNMYSLYIPKISLVKFVQREIS